MRFEYATATRILFGPGTVKELRGAAESMGKLPLLVTGSRGAAGHLASALMFRVSGEPTVDLVREGVALARAEGCDVVVSFGGGSAIDAGKAIAALAANSGEPLDYLEVVGRGQSLAAPPLPFIAVPTTAGTGSEVTRNAVLGSPSHRVKASLRSPMLLPKLAIVDPDLTLALPPDITASTGLDALTQLIEPYVSARANAMTDMFCLEGICRAARSLERACRDGANLDARTDMSMASLLGGMALANAGLGAVHGFAAPVGGEFDAPHGAVCAALLPHAIRINVAATLARAPQSETVKRYTKVARILTGHPAATPEHAVEWIAALCRRLEIPTLAAYGVRAEHVAALVDKAAQASSMKANPIALTREELTGILMAAL